MNQNVVRGLIFVAVLIGVNVASAVFHWGFWIY
jgi:hypothetical protein